MPDSPLTPEQLREFATNPKRGTNDGQTVEQHSLKDLIEFDKYQRSRRVRKLIIGKIIPPGGS